MKQVTYLKAAGLWTAVGTLLALIACGGNGTGLPPETVLTPEGANHQSLQYSPDGSRIAYWAAGTGGWDLMVAQADLSAPRKLASAPFTVGGLPIWSPDDRAIAFASSAASLMDIWSVPADSGEPRQITHGEGLEVPVQWHPAGDRLAYIATVQGGAIRAGVVDLATGGTAPLLTEQRPAFGVWSPDGSKIAYNVIAGGQETIWLTDSTGGDGRQLSTEGFEELGGAATPWSPDGTQLLYVSRRTGMGDVWVMPVDGSTPRQLTRDIRNDYAPDWSPDGKWVAFLSNRGRQTDVWLAPAGGGTELRVTDDPAEEDNLEWRPGTTQLAFLVGDESRALWTLSVADGAERRLTPDSIRVGGYDLSPDGTQVVYSVQRGGGVSELQVLSLAGGPPRTLVAGSGENSEGYWSPDGSKVAFLSNRGGSLDLWIVDASGGEPRRLTDWPTDERDAEWAADGSGLYFLSPRDATLSDLWFVPVSGGEPRRITRIGTLNGVEPSPVSADVFVTAFGARAGQLVLSRVLPSGSLQTLWDQSSVLGLSHHSIAPAGDTLAAQVELPGGGYGSVLIPTRGGKGRAILGKLESPGGYSPDGTQLVYFTGTPNEDLGLLNLRDGSTRRLTTTPEDEQGARWTPDGKTLVILRSQTRRRIATVDVGGLIARAR
jgi:Tol biopolymer transport system component